MNIDSRLIRYVEEEIIPLYDKFDKAHRRDHVNTVIEQSLLLASNYNVDINMVYAIAAFHDVGLCKGREFHHIESADIVRGDKLLNKPLYRRRGRCYSRCCRGPQSIEQGCSPYFVRQDCG